MCVEGKIIGDRERCKNQEDYFSTLSLSDIIALEEHSRQVVLGARKHFGKVKVTYFANLISGYL